VSTAIAVASLGLPVAGASLLFSARRLPAWVTSLGAVLFLLAGYAFLRLEAAPKNAAASVWWVALVTIVITSLGLQSYSLRKRLLLPKRDWWINSLALIAAGSLLPAFPGPFFGAFVVMPAALAVAFCRVFYKIRPVRLVPAIGLTLLGALLRTLLQIA
jgi:hypothetical protein